MTRIKRQFGAGSRPVHWGALLLVFALLAAACGDTTDETTATAGTDGPTATETTGAGGPVRGGTLVVACSDTVPDWNTTAGFSNECGFNAVPLVLETPAMVSDDFTGVEMLGIVSAEPNDSFTQWTLVLREGMTFHNGSPVTADDLKFSLDRLLASPEYSYLIGAEAVVEVVDEKTVTISSPTPNAEVLSLGLAGWNTSIIPKDYAGMTAEEFFLNPIGAGPYKIEKWVPGDETVLVRNDDYWDPERPYLDKIIFKSVPDDNARIIGVESGDFDVATQLPTNAQTLLSSEDAAIITIDPSAISEIMYMSAINPPLDDPDLRRAIWYAINRQDILDGAFDGNGTLPQGVIPSGLPNTAPGTISPELDLDKAREFLAQSTYPDGTTLEVMVVEGDLNRTTASQIVQANLAEIGIEVEIVQFGFAEFFDRVLGGETQSLLFGYEAVVAPPSDIIGYFVGTGGFFGGHDTAIAAEQFVTIQATTDPGDQSEMVAAFETMIAENAYAVPIAERFWVEAVNNDVRGLVFHPTQFARWDRVWLDR